MDRPRRDRLAFVLAFLGFSFGGIGVTLGYLLGRSVLNLLVLVAYSLGAVLWGITEFRSPYRRSTPREDDGAGDPGALPQGRTPGRPRIVLLVALAGFVSGTAASMLAGASAIRAAAFGLVSAGLVLVLVGYSTVLRDMFSRRDGPACGPDP